MRNCLLDRWSSIPSRFCRRLTWRSDLNLRSKHRKARGQKPETTTTEGTGSFRFHLKICLRPQKAYRMCAGDLNRWQHVLQSPPLTRVFPHAMHERALKNPRHSDDDDPFIVLTENLKQIDAGSIWNQSRRGSPRRRWLGAELMRYRLHAEREKEGGKEGRLPEHEGGFMRAVLMNGAFLSREGRRWWSVCTEGRGKNKRLGEKSSPEREADTRN